VCGGSAGTWGALTLLREAGRPQFASAEVRFAASLAGLVSEGLRRAVLLAGIRHHGDHDHGAGIIVLAPDGTVEMANLEAGQWLAELQAEGRPSVRLPVVVRSVAGKARIATVDGDGSGVARARVCTRAGRWVAVRGSVLGDGPESRVAITIDAAQPAELAPLIADAYGFTERERRITELVARGLPTSAIAARLHLSAYTVQTT
jgi:hypothetical protein